MYFFKLFLKEKVAQVNIKNLDLWAVILEESKKGGQPIKFESTSTETIVATIVEKMSDANSKVSKKAEECVTEVIMTGGYFPLNLVSAFLFSDKSYLSSRLKGSVKQIFT